MKKIVLYMITAMLAFACFQLLPDDNRISKTVKQVTPRMKSVLVSKQNLIHTEGKSVQSRIKCPDGYERMSVNEGSFAHYLRNIPVKDAGSAVYTFDGNKKFAQDVHVAVLDIDVGERDLQQCADAVMRLRAEYLYEQEKYDNIRFNFTNGFDCRYDKWRNGYRVKVSGNEVSWYQSGAESRDYASFRKYLDMVFSYAGSLSLSQELNQVNDYSNMQIGDVLVLGGSPGHAMIVLDMAEHSETGEKLYLLAQSYMPAQDIHIVKNPNDGALSPWYSVNSSGNIYTPEYTFTTDNLMRF